jgi:hypothetical protein
MKPMRADEFRALLDEHPFRPFRVLISSGQYVDITHPEAALVGHSYFAAARRPNRRGIGHELAVYSLIHVVKITYLKTGKRKRRAQRSA